MISMYWDMFILRAIISVQHKVCKYKSWACYRVICKCLFVLIIMQHQLANNEPLTKSAGIWKGRPSSHLLTL